MRVFVLIFYGNIFKIEMNNLAGKAGEVLGSQPGWAHDRRTSTSSQAPIGLGLGRLLQGKIIYKLVKLENLFKLQPWFRLFPSDKNFNGDIK
jgi:hypothetical protein